MTELCSTVFEGVQISSEENDNKHVIWGINDVNDNVISEVMEIIDMILQ